MSSENSIHIKLNYMEALEAKRSILSSELNSLNIAKRIARYRDIRMDELGLKSKLYVKIKETKANIRKLQILLPMPKVPKIVKREQLVVEPVQERSKSDESGIESQLKEIQRRLNQLQRENI